MKEFLHALMREMAPAGSSGSASSSASSASSSSAKLSQAIFNSKNDVNATGVLVIYLLLFIAFVEVFTNVLERFLARKHLLVILILIYKEAMIVGICTIMLYIEKNYHLIDKILPNGFDYKLFKKIDMTMFLCVLVYIGIMSIILGTGMRFANGLRKLEESSLHGDSDEKLKIAIAKAKKAGFFGFKAKSELSLAQKEADYNMVRKHFVKQHRMESDFPFYIYLRKCTRESIQGLAGVHWNVWLVIFLFAFLNSVRMEIFGADAYGGSIEYFVGLYLSFLLVSLLYFKISSIKKEVLKLEFSASQRVSADPEIHGVHASHSTSHGAASHDHDAHDDDHGHGGHGHGKKEEKPSAEKKKHLALFWRGKPSFVTRCIQFAALSQAISIPTYGIYFAKKWAKDSPAIATTLTFFALAPSVITVFIYLPTMLPELIFSTSIGELSRAEFIDEAAAEGPSGNIRLIDDDHKGSHGKSSKSHH